MKTVVIAQARLKEILHYNPSSGLFTRLSKTGRKGVIGQVVGSAKKHGYLSIQVDNCRRYAHQWAWFYMTGDWPKEVDHKNGDRSDNRWVNLRLATRFLNNGNRKKHRGSLPKGVVRTKNRGGSTSYRGRIIQNGKQIHLGSYPTPEQAHAAYVAAAEKQYGQFARAK